MRKFINIMVMAAVLVLAASCQNPDEFLNKQPLDKFSEEAVWSDPALIETFVNTMYRNSLGWPFAIERLSDYSDESFFTPDWDVTNFNKGLITQDRLLGWQVDWASKHTLHYRWEPLYQNIRRTNIFFSKIDGLETDETEWVERMKGEVYFTRAWTYHFLTCLYGGVPIITKVYGLNEDYSVARNTYEECIDYIIGQCDSAAMYLPEVQEGDNAGRATKGAAMALKARVLLYAASDLHHLQNTYASGFANPELLGYVGANRTALWTEARDAAKEVIDMGMYSLYKADPDPSDSIAQNFVEYFTSMGTDEDILLQYFTPKTDEDWDGYNPALYCGPNGYHNWGNNTPLGDLVDEYEMKDGSSFDWNNPAQKANPYLNRDARFYASILYEGVQWRTRPSDALTIDPYSKIQVGHVYKTDATTLAVPGLDTRQGPIEDWNGGKTGYYLRKWVDPTKDPQYVKQTVPFKHIRLGEVYLNYAEACNELGQDAEALTYLNMIRKRAGQPELVGLTGNTLRQAIRHERRIELAFEDHRFWDVRRWIIGPVAYHQTSAVDVKYFSDVATSYRQPDGTTWGNATFTKKDTPGDARAWDNKCYFFPIMRDEMNRNTLLIQNPGY
ncbi:MAG: RagB/SusD family nutrient uptake outer membrane protein [Bacteroidales bacterium]